MSERVREQIQRQQDAWRDAQPFYPDKSALLLLLTGKTQDQRTDDLIALCGLCGKSLALESDIRDITIRGGCMKAHGKCASDRLTDRFVRASAATAGYEVWLRETLRRIRREIVEQDLSDAYPPAI